MWVQVVVALCFLLLLVVKISHLIYTWSNPSCNGKLPPGSMGYPLIGETIEFFTPHEPNDITPFITKRMARYGKIFRTSLFGKKVIVSTDPELNYAVFQEENKCFQIWYPESTQYILGQQSLLAQHGTVHKYIKNLVGHLVGPENLRKKLLQEVDEVVRTHLHSWACHGNVDLKEATADMLFDLASKKLISYDETKYSMKLRDNYNAFMDGLVSFRYGIPGTALYSCLQGRKKAIKVIKDMYQERKASKIPEDDFLDLLIKEVEKEDSILTESIAIDLVFLLLFAAYETTSSAMTLAVKFIDEHPHVLAELLKEHETILRRQDKENSGISWEEYKSMTFTHMFINETVRMANIAPMMFRKLLKDVEVKGYTLPADWIVMVVSSVVHLDPHKYEDPFVFNPWRWEGKELHNGSKTFMAFGGGSRLCVGADFAKLQMAIFLHYFTTKYKWSIIKGGDFLRSPGPRFPNGFHIKIEGKNK